MNSEEIARLANVSRATVSRVLNGHSNVSEATRKKIQEVMEQYHYFPDEAARQLAGKSTRLLGLFVVDFSSEEGEYTVTRSPFFYEFVSYAIDIANMKGYNLVVTIIHENNIQDIERLFATGTITGGIVMGDILDQKTISTLAVRDYRLCFCHQIRTSPTKNIITCNHNNYAWGYAAGKELIAHGHQKLAQVTGEAHRLAVQDRLQGFVDAMNEADLPFNKEKYLEYGGYYCRDAAYKATIRLLERNRDNLPTALFVTSSMIITDTMRAIHDFGLKVPDDLSVICLDEVDSRIITDPPLTVVSVSSEAYAKLAVRELINLVEQGPGQTNNFLLTDMKIIHRQSIRDA